MEAAARWVQENPQVALKVPFGFVAPDHWPHAGFPLGVWLADQRKYYNAGELSKHRIQQLDALGMVWNHQDLAFEEGLTVARAWDWEHGHFLPPATAVWNGHPIGTWAKNMRGRAWRERHAMRAGCEATVSETVHAHGLRSCRYRGIAKTHVQHVLTAAGTDIVRLSDCFPPSTAPSRPSRPASPFQLLCRKLKFSTSRDR
ncbi:Helicase associated domain protein [Streptomyces sp. BPTC-684]|nr:Helicase associated domain protein [Streptomyces sp. BPTC-684]WHM41538.1 Helicase associated domain protein [Streptomyces sp. BPTC-684]